MKRLLLILLLFVALPAAAQSGGGYMAGTPQELAALASLQQQKLVRLREQAREIIRDNPNSYAGHYLMGYSLHHGEGDLPRARFHLERGRELFSAQHGPLPSYDTPWGWLERMLTELEMVNAEMDLYEEQIEALDQYCAVALRLFGRKPPQAIASYAWPLMKLGKEQEARDRLKEASQYNDEMTRTIYWNTLGALEMEMGHPKESYTAFKNLLYEIERNGWTQTCTYLRNGGEAAASLGQFDEAERLYLESADYFDPYSFSNPWWDLTNLYLTQGRFPEAVESLKKMHFWSFSSQPYLAQQSWAANQHLTCEVLLQLGFTEKAAGIAREFVRRPDRQGGDSVHKDQWEAGNLLMFRTAALAHEDALAERMTWTRGLEWWKLLWERNNLRVQARAAGAQAASILASNDRIGRSLRYSYAPGTVIVPNWQRPELVGLYGPGVAGAAVAEIYQNPPESIDLETPYLNVIEAEVARRSGDRQKALDLLDQAMVQLPRSEVSLRARAKATAGKLLADQGRHDEAMAHYQEVLDSVPGMFRFLDIRLPVTVQDPGNDTLRKVAKMIRRSPRFTQDSRGFIVELTTNGATLEATLTSARGTVISRAQVPVKDDLEQATRDLASEFHRKTFAPRLDLSQVDLNSLDGSNLSGSTQTDRLKDLFFESERDVAPRL